MTNYFFVFLLFLLGIIIVAAARTGSATDDRSAYILAACIFIFAVLLGVATYLDSDLMMLLLIPVPVGLVMTCMSIRMITRGFFYSQKAEGTYIDCRYTSKSWNGRKYYALTFQYRINNRNVRNESNDTHLLSFIENNYEAKSTYTIWINPKNLLDFRVKRFEGAAGGMLYFITGIAALGAVLGTGYF